MRKFITIGIGVVISVLLSYLVLEVTGLYASCESMILKHVLGIALAAIYVISFRSGLLRYERREQVEKEELVVVIPGVGEMGAN